MRKTKLKFVIALASFALLTGCSTVQLNQPNDPGVNSATIHVKRASSLWGVALRAPVYVNNQYVGKIASGDEIEWKVKPGRVTVSTSSGVANINGERQNFNIVKFNAQSGKTYNISLSVPYQVEFGLP